MNIREDKAGTVWTDADFPTCHRSLCCKDLHICQPDCVIGRDVQQRRKQRFQSKAASPLLGLHVRHQSIHSGNTLHSRGVETEKQTRSIYISNAAQRPHHGPRAPAFCLCFLLPPVLCLLPCPSFSWLSPHVWCVKVLFPRLGATYAHGTRRVVCVDDCQQQPFIQCQASVLWGGKYRPRWIMVVLVCRQNPRWQSAEGCDTIAYEETLHHGRDKHCPSLEKSDGFVSLTLMEPVAQTFIWH